MSADVAIAIGLSILVPAAVIFFAAWKSEQPRRPAAKAKRRAF
jgi:hypothetical protein